MHPSVTEGDGMGGRWWLGLLAFLPLGLAAAAAEAQPAPEREAPAAATEAEPPTAVSIVSGDTVVVETTSGPEDTFTGDPTPATGTLLLAGECPDSVSVTAVHGAGDREDVQEGDTEVLTATPEPIDGSSTCHVALDWPEIDFSEPASGRLVVSVGDLDDATVAYQVKRTSSFSVFARIAGLAVGVGVIGWVVLLGCVGERRIPEEWSFKDGWASSLTGLTAVAAGLFALSGVLLEYAPQYSTAGALAANLVVLVLVGAAPVTFSALVKPHRTPQPAAPPPGAEEFWSTVGQTGGRRVLFMSLPAPAAPAPAAPQPTPRRRAFVAAGVLSLIAATGQACLVALVVLSGSTDGLARAATWGLLGVALVLMLVYAGYQARTIQDDDSASI